MPSPQSEFVARLDLAASRLVAFPGFIFLCGGKLDESPAPPLSVRDVVWRRLRSHHHALASRIIMAERVNNWSLDSLYGDLFKLESHLAALASLIVIFVESPGSIAELGAFSAMPAVNRKLLVFIQSPHDRAESFIALGPTRHLKSMEAQSVCPYPWVTVPRLGGEDLDIASAERCARPIVADIELAADPRLPRIFNDQSERDQMLLICDVVDHLIALKMTEIHEHLSALGIDIEIAKLRQYLFVLEKLGLLKVVDWARRHQYYMAGSSKRFFGLRYRAGSPTYDRERVQAEIAGHYKATDKPRHDVITHVLATEMRGGP